MQRTTWMVGAMALAWLLVVFQVPGFSQARPGEGNLTYTRGQSVIPVYQGWTENADGSFNLHFSYLNQNWEEELDIPVGPNNSVVRSGSTAPDAGQPTHFYPRLNRWQFTVKVPKDFGTNEVIWTLTSHGGTNRAYGTLAPGYAMDDYLIQFEFGGTPVRGRKPPTVTVEGSKERQAKVGQPVALAAVAVDTFVPPAAARGRRGGGGGNRAAGNDGPRSPNQIGPGDVGGDFIRSTAAGLRLAWLVYRGDASHVSFDPPMPFKVWEDQRGGSPWAPGFQVPPVPADNRWLHNVTFSEPGEYTLRVLVHTGSTFTFENITFFVTR